MSPVSHVGRRASCLARKSNIDRVPVLECVTIALVAVLSAAAQYDIEHTSVSNQAPPGGTSAIRE